ncbi:hypothetical protein [Xenorhabdus bovienii]|uniref:hypothetical protein n=1 Tax=Xenorhabdus bovienii TaxID=40576 RepID=UPI0023B30E96|nr:hypothetical protein [Xenorhabdus bovienii]MDE9454590.1 hypothetical protein [Xenorhabdus bovienii]
MSKWLKVFVVASAGFLSACSPSDDDIREAVKEQVNRAMKDPTSSLFRDIALYRDGEDKAYACGEVNGKNEYGAYTGFKPFIANVVITKDGIVPLVDYADSYSYDSFAPLVCDNKSISKASEIIQSQKDKVAKAEREIETNKQRIASLVGEDFLSKTLEKIYERAVAYFPAIIEGNRLNTEQARYIKVRVIALEHNGDFYLVSEPILSNVTNPLYSNVVYKITPNKIFENFGFYITGSDDSSEFEKASRNFGENIKEVGVVIDYKELPTSKNTGLDMESNP